MPDSLGDRMKKNYEDRYRIHLTRRTPVIIRLDGKAFHTLTKKEEKPFSPTFIAAMCTTGMSLCEEIQNCKCAYIQSDEISLLLIDYDNLQTEAWFDYNLQKMVSVSGGLASAIFTIYTNPKIALFDARAFNIPREEVCNYFIWRQKDWIRNSVHMFASSFFSHKELHKKSQADMHEMLHKKDQNWADLAPELKNGSFIARNDAGYWTVYAAPDFSKEREEIERFV